MGTPLRLMIIEDSASDADLMVLRLKKAGYDVSHKRVEDGAQMWQALQEQTWDVIISGHNLPRFDSLRALQVLKDSGLDIPFIIVSGTIGEEIAVRAMKSGAQDYVPKDNLTRLAAAVEREIADAKGRKAQKHAEEALHESEERFRSLYENSTFGIYRTTPDGHILLANPALLGMLGYSNFDELASKNLEETLFEPSYPRSQFLELIEKSGEIKGLESSWKRKDGSLISVRESARAIRDIQGKTLYYDGTVEDITERKYAEMMSLKHAAETKSIIDTVEAGILWVEPASHNIIDINPAACRMVGLPKDKIVGLICHQFICPSERGSCPITDLKQNVESSKRKLLKASGETIDIIKTVKTMEIGGQSVLLETFIDISELMQTDRALKDSEEKFRNLADQSPNIIFIHSGKKIVYVNQKAIDMMGYSQEEFYSPEFNFFSLIAPEFQEQMKSSLSEHMKSKEVPAIEYAVITKDGKRIEVILSTKLIDYGGQPAILGTITDISERKRAEDERRRMEEKAQVSSRLAAVGEMAAGIAHEINNPLTSVIGFSELLMRQDLPQEVMEEIKIIAEGSQRVADIVKRLLTFARQNKPVKTALNINALIDNTLKLRTYVLNTANISVHTCYDQSLPWTTADPGQLQQVFLNLIVNAEQAIKSAHNGGELKIITEKHDQRIHIVFEDDGPGITKENLARLFEPFFTTKGPGEGTGLGLSLSRSIVLEHGGEIWAESEPGHGATFIVELPLSEAPAPPTDTETLLSAEAPKQTPSARILVVDDESSVRDYLRVALTAAGHSVDCVGEPEEALKVISDNSYDIIFLDIRMPGMSGTELYGRILQKAPALARRVIFMTGDASDAGIRAFLTRNNLPFLTKPFEGKALEDKVRSCLEAD